LLLLLLLPLMLLPLMRVGMGKRARKDGRHPHRAMEVHDDASRITKVSKGSTTKRSEVAGNNAAAWR